MVAARLSLAAFAVTSTGCGTSPPSTFYALSPDNGAPQPATVHTIRLRRPGIAGYLDRPEIVRKVVDHRLGVVDTDRWAAPLDEMVERVLAQDVEQRLAGSVVFTEDGAITADADLTLEVDLRRFEVGEGGVVDLAAEVAIEKGDAHTPAGTRSVHLHATPATASTASLVGAMSQLLGQLGDEIAAMVRSTPAQATR
jgi:uncharacterized lipoprotein YmbA